MDRYNNSENNAENDTSELDKSYQKDTFEADNDIEKVSEVSQDENDSLENNSSEIPLEDTQKKTKKHSLKKLAIALVAILGCGAVGAGVGSAIPLAKMGAKKLVASTKKEVKKEKTDTSKEEKSQEKKADKETTPLAYASSENVELIKKVKPSVVCITSTVESQGFFNMTYESEGSGSGIIFSKNDKNIYIVTNCHVVEGAENVSISLDSDKTIPADLVGKNTTADLAVISVSNENLKKNGIDPDDIQLATFGDSSKTNVGAQVIAIGNALGDGNTATSGVVSAVDKEVNINGKQLTVIQTDSAINPGNSGGALINSKGEVIGINTAKIAETSVEGVGYSITSNFAKPLIEKLMNNENTPFLGVYISDISDEMVEAYNLPKTGVLITQIIPNSSAANSDLQESDIITGIDDIPIFTKEQLLEAMTNYKIGDEIKVKIIRNGKNSKTITVKLTGGRSSEF